MLTEYTSKNLNVPFVIVQKGGKKCYLCNNGVLFTDEEYKSGIDLIREYETRANKGVLYDYVYAKDTGLLKEKKAQEREMIYSISKSNTNRSKILQSKDEEVQKNFTINIIIGILTVTSVICMYVSTLHTATYLYDYVDLISAWLMSASVTAYSSTAFEVSVIFKHSEKYFLSALFILLWVFVTFFSMATTVSVFYDRFNFNEQKITEENKTSDSSRLALDILLKEETDLRESISFKKKDMENRLAKDWATTAVRKELNELEEKLQSNLEEQKELLKTSPEITSVEEHRKESLFSFLGRLMQLEGGILEFIMSTLSAIFVNLICPLSITAIAEMKQKS